PAAAGVVPDDLRHVGDVADGRLGDDPLSRRADHDRRPSVRGGPDRRRRPVAADLARHPAGHPAHHRDAADPQHRHVHGRGLREGPAAVQPADVPDRRRDHDLPVPDGRGVQQPQLRRRDRPVRGADRDRAHHLGERDLPPHSRDEPVVTLDRSPGYRVFRWINALVLTGVVIVTLYPFANIISRSFSEEQYIVTGQVNLLPRGFNLSTYQVVISDPTFWTNYRNTVIYTVVATAIAMFLTTCYSYVLSKNHLKGRTVLIWIAVFIMIFSGGLIPQYVLVNSLGLTNTLWAIVLPNAISVFNLLVMKAFFENLPGDLEEAAAIDGLNTYGILWRIVLPLSKAVIATMVLFYSVSFWNSWFTAFLYLHEQELFPVTIYLRNLIAGATTSESYGLAAGDVTQAASNIQSVAIMLTVLPILAVYPFVQRYFVSGVMLGAVKG